MIFTIGHSNRSVTEFLGLLGQHGVQLVVDVRRFPGSRRHPHFGKEQLTQALQEAQIGYRHDVHLGGRRSFPRTASPNTGWRNDSFRSYADYMLTDEFVAALERLVADGEATTPAIMCSEAVPWRCHRNLVSDALTVRDVDVRHITSSAQPTRHTLTSFARVEGTTVTYPPEQTQLPLG